jgi:hypothetical protein
MTVLALQRDIVQTEPLQKLNCDILAGKNVLAHFQL